MNKNKLMKIVMLSGLLLGASWQVQASDQMPPVPAEMTKPLVQAVQVVIETTGLVKAESSAVLTPEIPGRIVAIQFKEGQAVEKDQVLFKLDDTIMVAELNQAQAKASFAKVQYERLQTLITQGTGNKSQRDEAEAELKAATAQVALIQARIEQASLKAPFSGVLGLSTVEVGDYVVPGQGLINLEAIDNLKVDFKVPETFLKSLNEGQEVQISLDGFPGRAFKGTVTAIDPQAEASTHSVKLRAILENADHDLKPGLFARVALVIETHANALLIPEQAVQLAQDSAFVYRVEDGTAHQVKVKTGVRQNGMVEIVSGLKEGDDIIISGQNRLYEGAKVFKAE